MMCWHLKAAVHAEGAPLARIVLVTGGSRSGKSEFARRLSEALPGRRAFVATCPVVDEEMRERIEKHKKVRSSSCWETIEETLEISKVLAASGFSVFLVDCLTLWINNLMFKAKEQGTSFSEEQAVEKCKEVLEAGAKTDATIIFVTNEVGSSIVPENREARLFRDLVGRCNQIIADAAAEVYLVVCGQPITLKKSGSL
jgi:adenosylcobinamide kinase / adenosylcobinamide-phosphate guanylyltransferase